MREQRRVTDRERKKVRNWRRGDAFCDVGHCAPLWDNWGNLAGDEGEGLNTRRVPARGAEGEEGTEGEERILELCYGVWGCVLRCGTLRPFVGHLKGSCGGCEEKNGPLTGVPAGGAGGTEGKEMAFGKGSVRYLFRCVKAFLGVQTGDMGGAGLGGAKRWGTDVYPKLWRWVLWGEGEESGLRCGR